jgi:hypothetical protein
VLKGENGWNNFSSVNVADWDVDDVMEWLTSPDGIAMGILGERWLSMASIPLRNLRNA